MHILTVYLKGLLLLTGKSGDSVSGQKNSKVNTTLLKRNLVNNWLNEMIESEVSIEEAIEKLEALHFELGDLLISILIRKLEDKNVRVRSTAAWALGIVGNEETIIPLRKILHDPRKSDLAKAAAITGLHELGEDIDLSEITLKNPVSVLKDLVEHFLVMLNDDIYTDMLFNEFFSFPVQLQIWFVHELSRFADKKVANFLVTIKESMNIDSEVKDALCSALKHLKQLEVEADDLSSCINLGIPYKAWASQSRDKGRVSLFIAWEKPDGNLKVLGFLLGFRGEGVSDFFTIYDLNKEEFNGEFFSSGDDLDAWNGYSKETFVEIDFDSAIYLVQQAYNTTSNDATCPIEFRRYISYIIYGIKVFLSEKEESKLLYKLIDGLNSPENVIRIFYRALANYDFGLAYDFLSPKSHERLNMDREDYIFYHEDDIIERGEPLAISIGKIEKVSSEPIVCVETSIIYSGYEELSFVKKNLTLKREGQMWIILELEEVLCIPIYNDNLLLFLTEVMESGEIFSSTYKTASAPSEVRHKLIESSFIDVMSINGENMEIRVHSDLSDKTTNGPPSRNNSFINDFISMKAMGFLDKDNLYIFSWSEDELKFAMTILDELLGSSLNIISVDYFISLEDGNDDMFAYDMNMEIAKESIINDWLKTPMPALDGLVPIEALNDPVEAEKLQRLLRQALIYQDLLERRGFLPLIDYREIFAFLDL